MARIARRPIRVRKRTKRSRRDTTSVSARPNAHASRASGISGPPVALARPPTHAIEPTNVSLRRANPFLRHTLELAARANAFVRAAERDLRRTVRVVGRRTCLGARRIHEVCPAKRAGRVRTSFVSPGTSRVSNPVDPLRLDVRGGRADSPFEGVRTRRVGRPIVAPRAVEGPERSAIVELLAELA